MLPIIYFQYYACWCLGDFRSQCISRYGIDQSRSIPSPSEELNRFTLLILLPHLQEANELNNECKNAKAHIDGLVQERRNSIANALELHLSCTYPSISFSPKKRNSIYRVKTMYWWENTWLLKVPGDVPKLPGNTRTEQQILRSPALNILLHVGCSFTDWCLDKMWEILQTTKQVVAHEMLQYKEVWPNAPPFAGDLSKFFIFSLKFVNLLPVGYFSTNGNASPLSEYSRYLFLVWKVHSSLSAKQPHNNLWGVPQV